MKFGFSQEIKILKSQKEFLRKKFHFFIPEITTENIIIILKDASSPT